MVVLRLSVARASRLAVTAWACASADSDTQRLKVSAQIERRRVVLSRARPTSLVTPAASIVVVPMADSAKEVTGSAFASLGTQCADRGDNVSSSRKRSYCTMVSIDT